MRTQKLTGAPFGGKLLCVTNVAKNLTKKKEKPSKADCFLFKFKIMSSRKCYVCSSKSSSRWFKIPKEVSEDVCACFNVKEIVGEESLCASCRRNLTRWREGKPTNGKYFVVANSKGKPFINKATIARQNRKTALLRSNFSEFSPLLQLPEDLFLVVAAFLAISDISRLRKTCSYANQLCTSNFLWKRLVKRDFPDKLDFLDDSVLSNSLLAYKLFKKNIFFPASHPSQWPISLFAFRVPDETRHSTFCQYCGLFIVFTSIDELIILDLNFKDINKDASLLQLSPEERQEIKEALNTIQLAETQKMTELEIKEKQIKERESKMKIQQEKLKEKAKKIKKL